jgi:hypothetical protein
VATESIVDHHTGGVARVSDPPAHAAASDERVLADLSHELGNFFHKLYYWAEHLRNGAGETTGGATDNLERTIRHLEEFLRVALEYFSPVEVSPTRMRAEDVLTSFVGHLSARWCGTPIEVDRPDAAVLGQEILVDPGRIAQAIELAGRHVGRQVSPDSVLRVGMRNRLEGGRRCVELSVLIERSIGGSGVFRTAEVGLEWALLAKLVRLHGGGLEQHAGRSNEQRFVIFIPVSG